MKNNFKINNIMKFCELIINLNSNNKLSFIIPFIIFLQLGVIIMIEISILNCNK